MRRLRLAQDVLVTEELYILLGARNQPGTLA
jgi:hypothetical protein